MIALLSEARPTKMCFKYIGFSDIILLVFFHRYMISRNFLAPNPYLYSGFGKNNQSAKSYADVDIFGRFCDF